MPPKKKFSPLISEREKARHAFSSVSAAQTYLYLQTSVSGHDPWPNLVWHLCDQEKNHITAHSQRKNKFYRERTSEQNYNAFQENEEDFAFGDFIDTEVLAYLQQQAYKVIQKDNMPLEKLPFHMLFNQPQMMMDVLKNQHEYSDFLPRVLEIIIEGQWYLHPDASVQSFLDELNRTVLEQHQDIWGALTRSDVMEIHDITNGKNSDFIARTQRDVGIYHLMLKIQAGRKQPFPLHENLFFDFSPSYEQGYENWLSLHHLLYEINSSSSKVLKNSYTFSEQDIHNYQTLEHDAFRSKFSNQFLAIQTSHSLCYAFQIYAHRLNTLPESSVSEQFKHSMVHAYNLQAESSSYKQEPLFFHQEISKILAHGNQQQSEFHLYCLAIAINSLSFEPPYASKELINVSFETLYEENNRLPFLQKLITCLPKAGLNSSSLLTFIFDSDHRDSSPMFSKNSDSIQIKNSIQEAYILSSVKKIHTAEKPNTIPLLSSRF